MRLINAFQASATVNVELCKFTNNNAGSSSGGGGGAIFVQPQSTTNSIITIKGSAFLGNGVASGATGNDIYTGAGGTSTVLACTTENFVVTQGAVLNTAVNGGGQVNGPLHSYTCAKKCDASSEQNPENGVVGTCNQQLVMGASCQPACNGGFSASGPTTCAADYTGTVSLATCVPIVSCNAGKFSENGECANCPANTFGAGTAVRSSCTACPDSKVAPVGSDEGSDCTSAPIQCPAGKFSLDGSCTSCPANSFGAGTEARLSCTSCPESKTSAVGSTSPDDCLAPVR